MRIESAMFDSSEYRYYVCVTIDDGIKAGDMVRVFALFRLIGYQKEEN